MGRDVDCSGGLVSGDVELRQPSVAQLFHIMDEARDPTIASASDGLWLASDAVNCVDIGRPWNAGDVYGLVNSAAVNTK